MLTNFKKIKLDILIFFLENKDFFLYSKSFKIIVFPKKLKKLFNFYFFKDYQNCFWISFIDEKKFLFFANFFAKLVFFKFLFYYCEFLKFNVFLTIGLGFRKKGTRKFRAYYMNVGVGKWTVMRAYPSYFFNTKRRSIFLLTDTKSILKRQLNGVKYLKKQVQFKTKGVMVFTRLWVRGHVPRSILFARRIKFYGIKIKLTKKQKQRK